MEKEGEILKVSNSRKVYIPFYFMVFILLATIIYAKFIEKPINQLAIVFSLSFSVFVVAATEIHRILESYEVNNHSIIHRTGIINITSKRLEFTAVSDSEVKQNLWQRLFSYGNVEVHSFSKENVTCIKNIDDPYSFTRFLQKKMIQFRKSNG